MAFLRVIKGSCPGQILELTGGRMVIGRHPNCEIVLDNAAVSRHHAQILESHGNYYLEDLRSRNRTYLNGAPVEGRAELHDADEVRVCDVLLSFHRQMSALDDSSLDAALPAATEVPRSAAPRMEPAIAPSESSSRVRPRDQFSNVDADASSIISTLSARSSAGTLRLGVKPEAKLRAVLEISKSLAQTLNLDDVLRKLLDELFKIFPQADEGFIMLSEGDGERIIVKAAEQRGGADSGSLRASMTIVKQAMAKGEAILSADALEDSRFNMSDSISGLEIRSMLCVPLMSQEGKALGVIQLDTKSLKQQFAPDDLDLLTSIASQATLAVENANMHEEVLRQRDMERELEFATQVQLGFLPNQRPRLPGYNFYDYYEAALRVGGDYFDYITLPDGRIAVALADVAGKGIPAALLMARLYSSVRLHLFTQPSAALALSALNSEIHSSGLGFRFITFVVVIVDPTTHLITISNAGHLPPVLRKADGTVEALGRKQSGMPLGVVPRQEYGEIQLTLEPGMSLTLYTDGVTEAMNTENDIYGRARLEAYIAQKPMNVDEIIEGVV
ncbi:MAG: SpoIIE family protein phosphatase, partial [Planctomycetaceae bacterium]